MAFAWCVRRSASKLASACDRARSISAVVNCPSLALNPSPFRPLVSRGAFFTLSANDRFISGERLLRVIESKILSALQTQDLEYVKETIPENFPFEIEDDPGDQFVRLTSTSYYIEEGEREHVKVLASMPSLVADEPSITLIVTVTRKSSGLSLELSCTAFADHINIDNVSVNHPAGSFEVKLEKDWHLKDLDDDLKKVFYNYLGTVVEASTTKLLHRYMMSKLKREYLVWLRDVKKFMKRT